MYKVLLDGALIGSVGNGETFQCSTDPGHHELKLVVDWTGSKTVDFDLGPGKCIAFRCAPAATSVLSAFAHLVRSVRKRDEWIALDRVGELE
jgi:hypothetical protein